MSVYDVNRFSGDGPEKVFRSGLEAGKILIQSCASCSSHIFYPRALCPVCGSSDLQCVEASGKAEVYSTTTIRQAPDKGGDYNLAMVTLAEGPRLMTQITGIDPGEVRIGMKVAGVIRKAGEQLAVFFEPA
ncbi:MAG: Zn-ribbon domain-containing OB-fold protein [Afipia sp.]|nr:Zn-ribbon domain-containing OB-fold protein [Afipia sp.]OJW65669.1 MAG: DNA-binding protein [Afipia sp. 64-13]